MSKKPEKQSNRPVPPPPDVLSDVLGTVRLHGTVFGSLDLVAPWGMSATPRDLFIFHIVARGECWFEADGSEPAHASTGDVLLLAPRRAHTLRDAPGSRVRPFEQVVAANRPLDDPRAMQLVCGGFQVDDDTLLRALPPVIHTHELASDAGSWLAQTVRLLVYEASHGHPGAATVVSRVCDALFVYVIRSALAKLPPGNASWLHALVTPRIGDALRLMHGEPSKEWSVGELAQRVGMSRSAFAQQFAAVVGDTPMQYLIQWRVRKAASLLRGGDTAIAEVAERVGYQSDVAFAKAFKRAMGVTPGAFRRAAAAI
jgi:AraC-like DNA-binding protein